MRRRNLQAFLFLVLMGAWMPSAMADAVVLVSKDGYLNFQGDLIKVDKNMYVLKTTVGVVRIPISDVICKGAGCPGLNVKKIDKTRSGIPSPASSGPPADTGKLEISKEWEDELVKDYRANELFQEFLQWRDNKEN